ncbi:MAG: metal-dependent hydrolase [Gemmatimonadales bacterium]
MPDLGRAQGQRGRRARREAGIDPICHTLVGAGLARSGLGKRTALGAATLVIGSNLPDLDVLAYLDGPAADLAFRRGWTHGILALALLPFALTGLMLLLDRTLRRLRRASLPSAVAPREVLLLSSVSILSHPILDSLNTYGVRWLMPFSGRWFYSDTLFIVDPWVWLALAFGLLLSRRRRLSGGLAVERPGPARMALLLALVYAAAMAVSGVAARRVAARELIALTGQPVQSLMVGPVLVNPFVRSVVAVENEGYTIGEFRWLDRPHLDPASVRVFPRSRPDHPAVTAALAAPAARRFLGWARFPVVQLEEQPGAHLVHIVDLRYADRPGSGFGSLTVPIAIQPASAPSPGSRSASSPAALAAEIP